MNDLSHRRSTTVSLESRNSLLLTYLTAATSFIPRYHDAETHDAEPQDTHQRATPGNPDNLVNSTISRFVAARASDQPVSSPAVSDRLDPIRVIVPFKDQASADIVRAQLKDLSHKIQTTVQPVFVSQKIERHLKLREAKPPIVNQQCLVYKFQCDLCDAGYVGFTRRHLH